MSRRGDSQPMRLLIVDYGLGNLGSVFNMFKHLGTRAEVSGDPSAIASADAFILPGVGHFDIGMKNLVARGIIEPLRDAVVGHKKPVLGICLGMQLFTRRSDEGAEPGLGWIDAETRRFDFASATALSVPHMGWNDVSVKKTRLFEDIGDDPRFYFVHSFHVVCAQSAAIAATTDYGGEITAAIEHENIFGTQFHPEKSHRFGMRVLENFIRAASRA
jgi:glutamine amidotransferase